jgi:sec-independent protein translocase protein TatB
MFDIGVTKLMIVGGIALIVIGPERLPRVARMVGTMVGRAQRYVAEVKAEVNRSIELDELKKMKDSFHEAATEVHRSVHETASEFERNWSDAQASITAGDASPPTEAPPAYRHPKKNWRLKRGSLPRWYKLHAGVRQHAQSGAARVARFRPSRRA